MLSNDQIAYCRAHGYLVVDDLLDQAGVPLPVRAGGVVILDPMLPHASLANRSDGIRWSFNLRYNRSGQPTGCNHFPEFVARSPSHPERELQGWRVWRDMWRAARARLAQEPHINIHRWRSDAPACA